MHNTIRELAISIFPNETYLFVGNSNPCPHGCFLMNDPPDTCSHGNSVEHLTEIPQTTRYLLTMIRDDLYFKPFLRWYGNLRTLLFYDNSFVPHMQIIQERMPQNRIPSLFRDIMEMQHLRFLDLSYTAIENLDESICSLCHLEFLDLRGCNIQEVPRNMNHLTNSRHFQEDLLYQQRSRVEVGESYYSEWVVLLSGWSSFHFYSIVGSVGPNKTNSYPRCTAA
jgi:hypothetical protein